MKYYFITALFLSGCLFDKNERGLTTIDSPFFVKENSWRHIEHNYENSYDSSLALWERLVLKNGNIYKYYFKTIGWVGNVIENTIYVENDSIFEIQIRRYLIDWKEETKPISDIEFEKFNKNTLPEYLKSYYKTMDENYKFCKDSVLSKDTTEYYIYYKLQNNGLIENCTYVNKMCADDCNVGVYVDSLFFLERKN